MLVHVESFGTGIHLLVLHHFDHVLARNYLIVCLIGVLGHAARLVRLDRNRVHAVVEHVECDLLPARRVRPGVVRRVVTRGHHFQLRVLQVNTFLELTYE